ncbi:uncharacterized protein LTR77_000688 [Saxophila tyrrhenica]|uniref:Uncharacterized protein n=1 Tax=Saxophila tyrrhenica TaxID=1690608 RepID=A0AAV9PNC2_9PEZI|nr:hypothetical protein LTR77_000688 [Saxophila tyrrhenica]
MGGSDQPYMYTPQRTVYPFSNFNPKAVTQAEYKKVEDEQRSKPKPEGPLINFNAHPDSYMIVSGQNVKYNPMPARTKKEVTVLRWVQFALRVITEIAALGILVCVICTKKVDVSLVWIMRLAPAADIITTMYAIYHLLRPAKSRTPGSSASYHIFALVMDIGLIPFYVFIAMYANTNYTADPDSKERWTSFFDAPEALNTLLLVTFIGSAVIGGLHLLSTVFDLWLIVLFRKISKLPPDMNPLEDNLTGRSSRTSKHKYKDSDATLTGSVAEKKPAYMSGSTISVDQYSRLSTANKDAENSRAVPFQHSRMDSQTTFSPHNPNTARWSREQFEDVNMYNQPASARNSRAEVNSQRPSPSKRSSFVENMDVPPPPPLSTDRFYSRRPISYPDNRSNTNLSSSARYSTPALPNAAPTSALVQSQQKQGLLNDNWISVDDDLDSTLNSPDRRQTKIPDVYVERHDSFNPEPLRMNPPTPPPNTRYEYPDPDDDQPLRAHMNRSALTPRNDNGNGNLGVQRTDTTSSSVYSERSPSLKTSKAAGGTPKSKYYGDLAAATAGVRGAKSNDTMKTTGTVGAAAMDSMGMMALGEYGYSAPSPPPQKMRTPRRARDAGGRVVSRTGVDIVDAQQPYGSMDMRVRRDVSGKVAEEGRGDRGWYERRGY